MAGGATGAGAIAGMGGGATDIEAGGVGTGANVGAATGALPAVQFNSVSLEAGDDTVVAGLATWASVAQAGGAGTDVDTVEGAGIVGTGLVATGVGIPCGIAGAWVAIGYSGYGTGAGWLRGNSAITMRPVGSTAFGFGPPT
jgi:hypothetical protein